MQGWPPHITNGTHTCLGASYATRLKQVGNALNNSQLYHILRAFTPASATVQHCPAPAGSLTQLPWKPTSVRCLMLACASGCRGVLLGGSQSLSGCG